MIPKIIHLICLGTKNNKLRNRIIEYTVNYLILKLKYGMKIILI